MKKDKNTDTDKITNFLVIFFIADPIISTLLYILFEILKIDGDNIISFLTLILPLTVMGVCHCFSTYDYSKKKKLTGLVTEFSKQKFGWKSYYQISVLADDGRIFNIETSNFRAFKYRYKKNIKLILMPENVMPKAIIKEDLHGRGELFLFLFFPIFYMFIIPVIAYLINGE